MENAYCSTCNKMVEAAIIIQMQPHIFQGVVIKCNTENAYCVYCKTQVYMTTLQDRNKERIKSEYLKKAR